MRSADDLLAALEERQSEAAKRLAKRPCIHLSIAGSDDEVGEGDGEDDEDEEENAAEDEDDMSDVPLEVDDTLAGGVKAEPSPPAEGQEHALALVASGSTYNPFDSTDNEGGAWKISGGGKRGRSRSKRSRSPKETKEDMRYAARR